MSQLYIVEGLPCSGKSSTAAFIAETLRRRSGQASAHRSGLVQPVNTAYAPADLSREDWGATLLRADFDLAGKALFSALKP